jgi:hypothetical protein
MWRNSRYLVIRVGDGDTTITVFRHGGEWYMAEEGINEDRFWSLTVGEIRDRLESLAKNLQ